VSGRLRRIGIKIRPHNVGKMDVVPGPGVVRRNGVTNNLRELGILGTSRLPHDVGKCGIK
jgi:hypothetical protein